MSRARRRERGHFLVFKRLLQYRVVEFSRATVKSGKKQFQKEPEFSVSNFADVIENSNPRKLFLSKCLMRLVHSVFVFEKNGQSKRVSA